MTWYGGEPLLGQDRLDRLSVAFLERTAAAGVDYSASIVTNGYLLTPETATRLRELGVRSAQITLDGPPETHNRMRPLVSGRPTFDVILDNIERSADLLPIAVRVNLDTSNAAEAETLLDLLAERGLGGRITVYPGRIVALDDGAGAPSETYAPRVLHPARVRGDRADVPRPCAQSWGSRRPSSRSRSAHRARRSAPTSWSWAPAASSTSAGTPWATSGR